jgi:hypothetical protein
MKPIWILSAWLAVAGCALAQQAPALAPADASTMPPPVPPGMVGSSPAGDRLPAGTIVELELTEAVASSRNQRGDTFGLRVVEAISVNGRLVIPAGSLATGQVVHAAASSGGGKAGELLLAARTVDAQGKRLSLRGMRLGGAGQARTDAAIGMSAALAVAVPVLAPLALFVKGREIEIPAGTRAHAKLAQDVVLEFPTAQTSGEPPLAGAQVVQPAPIEIFASPSN